jgi:hypothetical protein
MRTLKIFLKKTKWLYLIIAIIFSVVSYLGLMIHFVQKYPQHANAILGWMLGGAFGSAVLITVGCQIWTWLKKSWAEAKKESEIVVPLHVTAARELEDKAANCLAIATQLFPPNHVTPTESYNIIQVQAADFMSMSDSAIRSTMNRISTYSGNTAGGPSRPVPSRPRQLAPASASLMQALDNIDTLSKMTEVQKFMDAVKTAEELDLGDASETKSLSRYDLAKGKK